MNVLILMPLGDQRGGAESALYELLVHGRNGRIEWHVLFFEDGPLVRAVQALGIRTEIVCTGRLREPLNVWRSIRRIADIARQLEARAILSWMPKAHLYGGPAARLAGIPAAWFQHTIPSRRNAMDLLSTLVPATGILACSRIAATAQIRLLPHRPTRVVYPPVDLDRFDPSRLPSPADARRRLGLPSHGPLIGIVGRLQRWKGFHVLVEAMPAILRTHPDAHCVLVGGKHDLEPHYPDMLRALIRRLELEQRVTMAGAQANVPEWMQAMDVFVHASEREPFGMVIVEAMALAKPLVATDDGGPAEVVTSGVDGQLTRFGDVAALVAAITRYLDDPDFAAGCGAAARRRSFAFSAGRFAAEVAEACVAITSGVGFAFSIPQTRSTHGMPALESMPTP